MVSRRNTPAIVTRTLPFSWLSRPSCHAATEKNCAPEPRARADDRAPPPPARLLSRRPHLHASAMQTPSPPIRRSARTSGRSAVEEIALEAAAVPPAPVKKVVAQRRVAPTPALKPVVVDSGAARNNPAKTIGGAAGARDSVSPRELISTATGFESALSDGTRVCEGEGEASTPRFARQAAKRAAQNNLRRKLERQFEKHRRESLEGPDAARAIKRVRLKSPAECDDAALDHGACPFEPLPMLTREELDADAFFAPGPGASPAALFGDEFRSLGAELLDWKTAGAPTEATAAMDADDAVSSAAGGDAAAAPAFARALERDASARRRRRRRRRRSGRGRRFATSSCDTAVQAS